MWTELGVGMPVALGKKWGLGHVYSFNIAQGFNRELDFSCIIFYFAMLNCHLKMRDGQGSTAQLLSLLPSGTRTKRQKTHLWESSKGAWMDINISPVSLPNQFCRDHFFRSAHFGHSSFM